MNRPTMIRLQANALLLLAALIWGSAFVAQVWGMDGGLARLAFTAACFALGALVVAPLTWLEWRRLQRSGQALGAAHLCSVLLLGSLLCVGVLLQQVGLQHTSVTNAGVLTALYGPLLPLLAWAWQRQRPGWAVVLAAPACLLGTALLTGANALSSLNAGDAWGVGDRLGASELASAALILAGVLLVQLWPLLAARLRGPSPTTETV